MSSFHQVSPAPLRPADGARESQHIVILHTNDMHGRTLGIARVATLVERLRAEQPDTPVLYFYLGDVEERSVTLSSLSKGVAMHRLLTAAGCDASAIGNAVLGTYGSAVLADEAAVARYPLLMANLTGSQVLALVARGLDPVLAEERPRILHRRAGVHIRTQPAESDT